MGIDMNYLMHGGPGSGRTPIKKGGAKNGESKYFIPGTSIRTESGKDHRAELENEEGNGLGREDPKENSKKSYAELLREKKVAKDEASREAYRKSIGIDTDKPQGERGSSTEDSLRAMLERKSKAKEEAKAAEDKAHEERAAQAAKERDAEAKAAEKAANDKKKAEEKAAKEAEDLRKIEKSKQKALKDQEVAKAKQDKEKITQEAGKAAQETEKSKQEAEKVKQEAGKAVLQTELGKQAELKTKAAEADFNLERRKKKAETKSAEAQAEVQQRLAEKNRLSVARDVETTASSGRKLANDAGSDAKKLIGAVSEKKRTKEAYDLDLSGYSTKDLNDMTARLNAEAAYRNARISDEGKRTRAAKASVDALSGIAGLAISGVATYYFIKKLKGD